MMGVKGGNCVSRDIVVHGRKCVFTDCKHSKWLISMAKLMKPRYRPRTNVYQSR